MLIKGFKFGMLLQLAVGPVCFFIFQLASVNGFWSAEIGVFAVVLVDGIYILAAIIGIASLIENEKVKFLLRYFGAIILFMFGFNILLEVFSISLLPSFTIVDSLSVNNSFLKGVILTASNPLTIIFWAGVFSTKIIGENMDKSDIYLFGIGALLSTLIFLSVVAGVGSLTQQFLSENLKNVLNIIVGIVLIFFGVKMLCKKEQFSKEEN